MRIVSNNSVTKLITHGLYRHRKVFQCKKTTNLKYFVITEMVMVVTL